MEPKLKIAVVEDNAMIRTVLVAALEQVVDCDVSEFGAVQPMVQAIQATTFDLFILDYRLPDLTGIEAIRLLRADARFTHAPIVMVTADADVALRLEAIRAGATDFLTKPINIEELRLRVGNLLALRRAQLDVAAREKLLTAVIEASSASIVIGDATQPDVPLIYVNEAFERLTGYSRAEVLNRNCRLLAAEPPDHPIRRALGDAAKARQGGTFRLRNKRRSGEVFWNQIDLHPVPDPGPDARYIVATQTDVTTEVEASQSRDQLGARLADIAQLSDAWFFEFDRNLCISYLSPAMATALDVSVEMVQGRSVDLIAKAIEVDPEGAGGDLRSLLARQVPVAHVPLRLVRRNGGSCWMQASAAPFYTADGTFDGVRGFSSDISMIMAARDAAQQAERAQAGFVAMMSHELRTPLTAIIGLSDTLLQNDVCDTAQADLSMIRTAATDLTSVLSDVLDHAQLQGGRLKLARTPLSLSDLLAELVKDYAGKAAARGLTLRLEVEGAAPAERWGDPDRLRQILRNLIDNAVRFTQHGGVVITLGLPAADMVSIQVADTGVGIDLADQARIFDPFVQLDARMGRKHGGRGLGLSLARKLAEAMGGTVLVQSQLGQGSTFQLDLPLAAATDVAQPATTLNLAGAPVLVADDNRANRKLLEIILSKLGAEVTLAEDGRAAMAAWAPGRFALLLLDINMPELTGTEVIADIRKLEKAAGLDPVPAFAVSANARPEQVEAYVAAGFHGCIAKPFTAAALQGALARQSVTSAVFGT
jgi:PAS domain S-box-containing protein